MRKRIAGGAALFAVSSGLTYAFILNLCHIMYQCGCKSWWSGADELCNIHQPDVRHCPWCSFGDLGGLLSLTLILIPQFVLSFWPAKVAMRYRVPSVIAMFPIAGGIVALGYGWYAGYWS